MRSFQHLDVPLCLKCVGSAAYDDQDFMASIRIAMLSTRILTRAERMRARSRRFRSSPHVTEIVPVVVPDSSAAGRGQIHDQTADFIQVVVAALYVVTNSIPLPTSETTLAQRRGYAIVHTYRQQPRRFSPQHLPFLTSGDIPAHLSLSHKLHTLDRYQTRTQAPTSVHRRSYVLAPTQPHRTPAESHASEWE